MSDYEVFELGDIALQSGMTRRGASIWGHRAGNPAQNPEDQGFLDRVLTELLEARV